jgi:hypothetical protein
MVSKESLITGAIIILITYTLGLSLISQAFPASQTTQTLSSTGSIQIQTTADIGIYSNDGCTIPLNSFEWGTLQPGGFQTQDCWIKNEGTTAVTLSMSDSNWSPANADDYLDISWDCNGETINPDEVIHATFTLYVDLSIDGITTFSFDITIVGTS